jgi:hypothetical protein
MSNLTDLTIYKGVAWQRTLTVTYPEGHASAGERRSLADATIRAKIKRVSSDADPPLIDLTVGDGVTILTQSGDTLGQATLDIAAPDAVGLDDGNYVIAVYVTPSGETVPQPAIEPTKIRISSAP